MKKQENIYLNGINIYHIIYGKDYNENVKEACEMLCEYLGGNIPFVSDKETEASQYEILIGITDRAESVKLAEGLGRYDYRIAVEGEKLVLAGGSDEALINAIGKLLHSSAIVIADDGTRAISKNYNFCFRGAKNREEYIADPNLFLCNWAHKYEAPQWMFDFEEKMAAFEKPGSRLMSCTHRGDWKNYPENSIESIISAIKMGADMVELDIRKSGDGILILFHDTTLERMTDWDEKAGKNGLPESNELSDWTYEQLTHLCLRRNSEGLLSTGGPLTDYIIPTFEEVLQVCKNRTTIRLDKLDAWDWDDDIYPLVKKTGAWRCCIPNLEFGPEKQKRIWETIKADSDGQVVPMWYWFDRTAGDTWQRDLDKITADLNGYVPMMRMGYIKDYKVDVDKLEPYLSQIKDNVRICVESFAFSGALEIPEAWEYMYEHGLDLILVDVGVEFLKYIAENHKAVPY